MRVLIIGSGGREHALAWRLSQECEVMCTPGNPGIAEDCEVLDVQAADTQGLVALVQETAPDLVIVGAEDPLVAGLADALREAGATVFGPGADGAAHEGSKSWSKAQMQAAGVPTAKAQSFNDFNSALTFLQTLTVSGGAVIKASGAALGKGVVVCDSFEEGLAALESMMVHRSLGSAGETVVVEERLQGREFSLLSIVSGGQFMSLPVAQDYKRIFDGDQGANTGGMGSFSPCPWVSQEMIEKAEERIVAPMVASMAEQGIDYRGVLFSGIMAVDDEPWCLEYNVRFGDPEIQSIVPRLGPGLSDVLMIAARGGRLPTLDVMDLHTVTVVLASAGYPGPVVKGIPVTLPDIPDGVKVFHAGSAAQNGQLVTNGGRVLAVTAWDEEPTVARLRAYDVAQNVQFEGKQYRSDIAAVGFLI